MARKKNQGSKWITKQKRYAIYFRDGFKCIFCERGLHNGIILTLDHVVPCEALPKPNNKHTNLITACLSCNSSKGAKSLTDYVQYRKTLGSSDLQINTILTKIVNAQSGVDCRDREFNSLWIEGHMDTAKLFLDNQ